MQAVGVGDHHHAQAALLEKALTGFEPPPKDPPKKGSKVAPPPEETRCEGGPEEPSPARRLSQSNTFTSKASNSSFEISLSSRNCLGPKDCSICTRECDYRDGRWRCFLVDVFTAVFTTISTAF